MYKLIDNYFSFSDERGDIKGIINFDNWQEVNYVKSKTGSIRGNHYHKKTREAIFLIDGEIEAVFQRNNLKETIYLKSGNIIIIEPETIHTFKMLKESIWINLLTIKNDKNNPDIYKAL